MRVLRQRSVLGAAVLVPMMGLAAIVWGDDEPTRQQKQADQGQAGDREADKMIAECLIIDNEGEIKCAELAAKQAQTKQVKEFAKTMIEDHTALLAKLEKFCDKSTRPEQADRAATNPQNERRQNAEERPAAGHVDFIAMKRQIAQAVGESLHQDLADKEGLAFDRCYLGQQVLAHTCMVATLDVTSQHVSPELQEVLQAGLATTKEHLAHAKKLHAQVEQDSGLTATRPKTDRNENE